MRGDGKFKKKCMRTKDLIYQGQCFTETVIDREIKTGDEKGTVKEGCQEGKSDKDMKTFHRKTSEMKLRGYRGGRVRQGERGAAV